MYKDDFLSYLRLEKRYSGYTIESYSADLSQYYEFCLESGSDDPLPDHRLIRLWVASMIEKGISARTVNRKLSALKSFSRYLIRQGKMVSNPVNRVIKPKMNKRIPSFVEQEKLVSTLNSFEFGDDYEGIRNQLIIEILYQTGIRRSEMAGLMLSSVDTVEMTIRVLGKRNKERLIPMSSQMALRVDSYIRLRGLTFPFDKTGSFFLTLNGEPVYPRLLYRVVNKFLKMVTTLGKKSPHLLRHTFATHLLNNGAGITAIKELLGHSNLSATQIYTHNKFGKLKTIYQQAHPRAK